jgi:Zn-dependent protease with chaperone function
MRTSMQLHVLGLAVLVLGGASPGWCKQYSQKQEERIGRRAAKQIEKQFGVIEDEEQQPRVQRIVDELGAVSERPDVKYTVKILAGPGVNAMAIPGGRIYVTRDLLIAADSDEELAGVLAHEIAHNSLYHVMKQLEKQKTYRKGSLAAILAGVLLGGLQGGMVTAMASVYTSQGLLSAYSIDEEREADKHAVLYMHRSHYDPVGLLSFMEKQAQAGQRNVSENPEAFNLGIYQTHPAMAERAQYILDELHDLGVTVNRNVLRKWARADAVPAFAWGQPAGEVRLYGDVVFTAVAHSPDGRDPMDRAREAADQLNDAIGSGMLPYEVRVVKGAETYEVTGADQRLFQILDADATALDMTTEAAAESWTAAIKRALIKHKTAMLY